jgi:hypothetical protein
MATVTVGGVGCALGGGGVVEGGRDPSGDVVTRPTAGSDGPVEQLASIVAKTDRVPTKRTASVRGVAVRRTLTLRMVGRRILIDRICVVRRTLSYSGVPRGCGKGL